MNFDEYWLDDDRMIALAQSTPSTEFGRELMDQWPTKYTGPVGFEAYRGVSMVLCMLLDQLRNEALTIELFDTLIEAADQAIKGSQKLRSNQLAFGGAALAASNAWQRAHCGAELHDVLAAYESEAIFAARKFCLALNAAERIA